MSHINDREFFDEYDNEFQIKCLIKKKRYYKAFLFLHKFFYNHHYPRITVKEFQEGVGIFDRSIAWQILESFRIMNLVSSEKRLNRGYYSPINKEFWNVAYNSIKRPKNPPKKPKKRRRKPKTRQKK